MCRQSNHQIISRTKNEKGVREAWIDLVTIEGRPLLLSDSKALRKIVKPLFDALDLDLLTSETVGDAIRQLAKKNEMKFVTYWMGN